jgi:hypothetical protein
MEDSKCSDSMHESQIALMMILVAPDRMPGTPPARRIRYQTSIIKGDNMSIGRVGARFTKEARAAAKSLHAKGKG